MTRGPKLNIQIYLARKGAVYVAKNQVHHQRAQHINIRYRYITSNIMITNIDINFNSE